MNKTILVPLCFLLVLSCTNKQDYPLSDYKVNYDGLLDTLLPYFAGIKTMPGQDSASPASRDMQVHRKERQYEWQHYTEKNGYAYFMVSRLQPSLKKDKYVSICGKFKRDQSGRMDAGSYEELFWTWKMKKDSLKIKSDILFKTVVETGDIQQYTPEKSSGFWVEFPSSKVFYDRADKTWKARD